MAKALDTGKSFLSGVLAKLPESLRNKPLAEILDQAEAADFLTTVGDSTLARSDYSRLMDELREKEETVLADHQKLTDWWESHKDYDTLKAEVTRLKTGGTPPPTDPPKPDAKYIDQDTFTKSLDDVQRGGVRYFNAINSLSLRHFQQFGEVLDVDEIVQLADRKKVTIFDAYKEQHAEKLKAAADKAENEKVDKLVDERLAKRMKEQQEQPFPLRSGSPAPIDILSNPDDKPSNYTVDRAVAAYEALQSGRGQ